MSPADCAKDVPIFVAVAKKFAPIVQIHFVLTVSHVTNAQMSV